MGYWFRWTCLVQAGVLLSTGRGGGSSSASAFSIATPRPIPITVLSGFLGSGKTSLLQHLLENKQGLKIAVVVNDVASVNIDSRLIAASSSSDGIVELQNGCACCSSSEEFLASLAELVTLSDLRADDEKFDHIVVELSGIADPRAIRSKWQDAEFYRMPLTERLRLDTLVTLVDSSIFLDYITSSKGASPEDAPELFARKNERLNEADDDFDRNLISPQLWSTLQDDGDNPGRDTSVAGLLAAQIETADVILLNKVDLVSESRQDVSRIRDIVSALATRALIYETEHGHINPIKILGAAKGEGVALAGLVDDHHDALQAVTTPDSSSSHSLLSTTGNQNSSLGHSHDPDCEDPSCPDQSHSHDHAHGRTEPDCSDSSHSHEHSHTCTDKDCTDSSHDHNHAHNTDTLAMHAGIGSFVYDARRPFHPQRLVALLKCLAVKWGLPDSIGEEAMTEPLLDLSDETRSILRNSIVRSKGFCWLANSNRVAAYWSHAGKSFELKVFGSWWATLPRDQWPPEFVETILKDFDDPNHDESSSTSVGDRRQAVVFIGPGLNNAKAQGLVSDALNQCLLDNDEWRMFLEQCNDQESLQRTFSSPLSATPVNM